MFKILQDLNKEANHFSKETEWLSIKEKMMSNYLLVKNAEKMSEKVGQAEK